MATLDIFNNDAFAVSQLTATITDIPDVPTKLGRLGLFQEYGISTTTMMIERQGASLKLVPTAPRGGVGEPVALTGRKLIPVAAVHLPQRGSVLADEVQNVRAFGSETEVDAVMNVVRRKLTTMRQQLDLTLEYQRVGALKGVVYDADGSTVLWDMYEIFGFTQETMFFNMATPSTTVDLKQRVIDLKRRIQTKLGGRAMSRVRVECSEGWFDKFIGHDKMVAAYDRWNSGAFNREDQSTSDFVFADVVFSVYSGGTAAGDFIPDGLAYAYPEGVPGMFQTAYAPADYMETVNTVGLPYYAKQEPMPFNKGVAMESQSNPITFNSLPEAVIELSVAAS